MESATKSPIFSHFQESLGGFSSIRAYGREEAFAQENINRLDANLRAYYGWSFPCSFLFALLLTAPKVLRRAIDG